MPIAHSAITVGFRADLESGEGEITDKNREKFDKLLDIGGPALAIEVIKDWIAELGYQLNRAVFQMAGEAVREGIASGQRGEPTMNDIRAIFDFTGQPYNEAILVFDFDCGCGTQLAEQWDSHFRSLMDTTNVVPFVRPTDGASTEAQPCA